VSALAPAAEDDEHARQLHEVRKAAKRVRYGAESLVASYGKPALHLTKAMKRVQSVLGDHQDAVVATPELVVLSEHAADKGIDSFELGRLHEREQEEVHRAAADFETVWRKASRKRYRKWL
jgi:CHAD domain-containing protein